MKPYFESIERYAKLEKILVDNGSGHELTEYARSTGIFDTIVEHPVNLGMACALNDAYKRCRGEYITLIEDDMQVDYDRPYIQQCIDVLEEYPEIGIVRLKNQNNWWKPNRIIGPLRKTTRGGEFWTWIPDRHGNNVWACGSTFFRKVSFFSTGLLETGTGREQAYIVENIYALKYNKRWLAAKIKDCYPVVQPNDNTESPGFDDKI
jgi:glycosyltransferase involved in cell wall biosynthesis